MITREQWQELVYEVLADHPDWAADTVACMQQGLLQALERKQDRISDLSHGLHEALTTRRGSLRRDGQRIIAAINASNFANTKWSADAIAKEEAK